MDLQNFGRVLTEVLVTGKNVSTQVNSQGSGTFPVGLIFSIYLVGFSIFGLKLIFDLAGLLFMINSHKKSGSRIIRFGGSLNTSGFSAMGYIFINRKLSEEDAAEIIRHEKNHIDHNHYIDILFIEIVSTLQWCNPFIFLLNRELRAVHEFQADEECLKAGVAVTKYQNLLLSQVFRTSTLIMVNSFSNPSLVRKRMMMMTKKRSRSTANLKLLIGLPVIAFLFTVFSAYTSDTNTTKTVNASGTYSSKDFPPPPPPPPVPEFNTVNGDTTWYVPDAMPQFPGGDEAIIRFVTENTVYPLAAKEKGIQGKVIVTFIIRKDGSIGEAKVTKSVDPEIDAEALRVISMLPSFVQPGIKSGRPVPVWYMLPISFKLN